MRGITSVLSRFGHEQYPSNNIDQNKLPHCVYLQNTLMKALVSLWFFVGLRNTLPHFKRYFMEPNVFMGHLENLFKFQKI